MVLTVLLAFTSMGCSTQLPPEDEGTPGTASAALATDWQEGKLLNHPRHSFTLTVLEDGTALVAGGRGSDMVDYVGNLPSSELYNPAPDAGSWTLTKGQMKSARMEHAAVRLPSNEVLVVGGFNDSFLATAERFTPDAGTWTEAGTLLPAADGRPRGRSWSSATLLASSGKVVVAGGLNSGGPQPLVDLYDVATGTWSAGTNLREGRWSHGAVGLRSGELLVVGGFLASEATATASAELYSGANGGSRADTGSLLTARGGLTATLLPSGRVLVAGGRNKDGVLKSAELYDPSNGQWKATTGSMSEARYKHTATLVNGKVLVTGGRGANDAPLASTEVFDPDTETWSPRAALPWSRGLHSAVVLENVKKVLVAGGWGPQQHSPGDGPSRLTALYDTDNIFSCNQSRDPCFEDTGTYIDGACRYLPKAAQTPCDGSKLCIPNGVCDGAGACVGATSCSTDTRYYCKSSTDRWKNVGTGACSTTGTCGSTDSLAETCASGTSVTCVSSTTLQTTTHKGCVGSACSSSATSQTCPTGSSATCISSTTLQTTTYRGCIGSACASSTTNRTCPTGTTSQCEGNDIVTTSRGGCGNGTCLSSELSRQTCSGAAGSRFCSSGNVYQNVYTGCSGSACTAEPQQVQACSGIARGNYCRTSTVPTSSFQHCESTANSVTTHAITRDVYNGCSGSACTTSPVTQTDCGHMGYCSSSSATTCTKLIKYDYNFVSASYRDVLKRNVDSPSLTFWTDNLGTYRAACTQSNPLQVDCWDWARARVVWSLLTSAEGICKHPGLSGSISMEPYKTTFLTALYRDLLQRAPDQAGLSWYLSNIPPSPTNETYIRLVYDFLSSSEYNARWQ